MNDRYWLLYNSGFGRKTYKSYCCRDGSLSLKKCQEHVATRTYAGNRYFIVHDIEYQRMWKEYLR